MKLSIFAKKKAWHVKQIIIEARKKNIKTNVISLENLAQYEEVSKKIGDVVFWRSSFLNSVDEKIIQTSLHKPLINTSHIKYPLLSKKLFQQKHLEQYKTINCIPTYSFNNILELRKAIGKELNFPLIQKPNVGAQGKGVKLVNSFADLEEDSSSLKKFIFQPFIKNSGDYRVLVLGGKVLGIIKRTAKNGSFLNNISQGGSATHITDESVTKPLGEIALKITSVFDLAFCGIDIIFSEKDGCYYFLELNTLPQWRGFQGATKINVAKEIVDYCLAISERGKSKTSFLVKKYFDNNFYFLENKKFHYSSRMFLWTKDNFYKKRLTEMKASYIGKNEAELTNLLQKDSQPNKMSGRNIVKGAIRKSYLKKYPTLSAYNKVLFKSVFAETIYKEDLRPLLKKHLDKSALLDLKKRLEKDKRALATLSTFAVNFIYNLSHYFKKSDLVDPNLFLTVAKENYTGNLKNCTDLQLYLLTHAIIGESKFYSRKITRHKKVYLQMIRLCEDIILKNYFTIPLDNKFEFLVCARLLNYTSTIEKMIFDEADRSLSTIGNFLIGRLNDSRGSFGQNILDAEHRNVLFLMANSDYKK